MAVSSEGRVALYLQDKHPIREAMEYVRYAEQRGFEAVWQAESRLVQTLYQYNQSKLTLALGKDIAGRPVCVDLARVLDGRDVQPLLERATWRKWLRLALLVAFPRR